MPKMCDLPNGEWAQIRTADEVPERLRRAHIEVQGKMLEGAGITFDSEGAPVVGSMNTSVVSAMGQVKDALILAHTKEWSFKVPVNEEALLDLPASTYDALLDACSAENKDIVLEVSPDQAGDPASPTVPLVG